MRNVALVCLDTVRKDYFDRFATRLRERADVEYHQARASSGWSVPSHASMFSGELPHVHGVHTHDRQYTKIARRDTFLGDLSGHTHVGVSANAFASRAYGFDAWFDEFVEVSRDNFRFDDALDPRDVDLADGGYGRYLLAALRHEQPIRSLANGALTKVNPYKFFYSGRPWPERKDNGTRSVLSRAAATIQAEEDEERPVFAFLNLMEAHSPMYHHYDYDRDLHSVPNRWTSLGGPGAYEISHKTEEYADFLDNWRSLYGASIDYLDRHVDAWIDDVQAETKHETTVVLTADHGHNLGTAADEQMFGHHTSLSEGVLHVPLLLVNPPEGYQNSSDELVSHLELGDLIRALARERVYEFDTSPVPAEVIGHTGYFSKASDLTYWDRLLRCLFVDGEKLVWDSLGTSKRYDLDPGEPCAQTVVEASETVPVADQEHFKTGIGKTKREAVMRAIEGEDRKIDEETKERLADLGYI